MAAEEHKERESTISVCSLCFSVVLGALVLPSAVSYAEDLTTLDGKTFTNITEVTKYPNLVVFTYNNTRTSVAISNLPAEFRIKHGVKEPEKKATLQTNSPQTNSVDWILARNRELDFSTKKTIHLQRTNQASEYVAIIDIHDCEISVKPKGFIFTNYSFKCDSHGDMETNGGDIPVIIGFKFGEEALARQIFDKFIEWEAIAATNNAQNFEKVIASIREPSKSPYGSDEFRTFTFAWDKDSVMGKDCRGSLRASYPVMNFDLGSLFYAFGEKSDILAFRELLKSVPVLKEELAQKIRDREAQKNLFK
jgi:hypothetical protein